MRRRVGIALLLFCLLAFSGCSIAGKEVMLAFGGGGLSIFKIGSMRCEENELRVYMANYKNIYGKVGETDLWSGDFDVDTMENAIRMLSVEHLARVYSMNLYAKDNDICLEDKELDKVRTAAGEYYASLNDKEKKYMKVKKRDIEEMYERYALAEKVYFGLMDSIDEDISEDEARVMDGFVIDTKDAAMAELIREALAEGTDFESLCTIYSTSDKGEISFSRSTYPDEVEKVAFSMENEEISDMIEADGTYYFIYCTNKYNKTLSEENKERIVSYRKKNAIEEIIRSQSESYYSYLNKTKLKGIPIDKDENIKTADFFKVLDQYLVF